MVYTGNDRFEWDLTKAWTNRKKHGVAFEEAADALVDPDGVLIYDKAHSPDEDRFYWIGRSQKRMLVVVFADRLDGRIHRIISARRATRKERRHYYGQENENRS